jgi:putative tricarboxylic transport membrane protein
MVLGPMLEQNFITSMIKGNGNFLHFFERPIAGGLGVLTILIWTVPLLLLIMRRRKSARAAV